MSFLHIKLRGSLTSLLPAETIIIKAETTKMRTFLCDFSVKEDLVALKKRRRRRRRLETSEIKRGRRRKLRGRTKAPISLRTTTATATTTPASAAGGGRHGSGGFGAIIPAIFAIWPLNVPILLPFFCGYGSPPIAPSSPHGESEREREQERR